jgi:hypothetical protein
MKRRYIIFYAFDGGFGNTEITVARNERPDSIKNIRAIETEISKTLNRSVSIINYKLTRRLVWR